jgi:CRP/FNR family transcriptional regulator, dissimilatory nitrate respiration regulator
MLQKCIFIEKNMDLTQLSKAHIFKGLSLEEMTAIISDVPHRIRKFKAGVFISHSGEPVNALMIVMSGTVKGEMVDLAGRVIKIEDIPASGAIASAFMFGNKNRFPVNVISIVDSELLIIDRADFLKLLVKNDKILVNFLDLISNRTQFLSEKIKFLNFKTIKSKLAHYILQKAGIEKRSIVLDLTQNDLADFFGVARPSVARALGELEEDGYIIANRKNIEILDKKGLGDLTID